MHRKQGIALQIERFRGDEDAAFRIHATKQKLTILQQVAEAGDLLALYYGNLDEFIITTLLTTDDDGIYMEPSLDDSINQFILHSPILTVVGIHREVKVQCTVKNSQRAMLQDREVFYLPLPDYLVRIQRREFFRMAIPASAPLYLDIQSAAADPDDPPVVRSAPILNISGGGVCLRYEEHIPELRPGNILKDCKISLPDIGTLTVTIDVVNNFDRTTKDNQIIRCMGCRFTDMTHKMEDMVQRYTMQLQSKAL